MVEISPGVLLFSSIFVYAMSLILIRTFLAIVSSLQINKYLEKKKLFSYKELLASPYAPGISIIARVNNDESTVVDTIREWLVLAYNNFDIIVVNDGSTDATLEKLISYYQLEEVSYTINNQLKTQEVYSYYKSRNPAFSKLLVVDKAFGGIADALNAGINASEKQLVFCIEQQCFLEPHSLLKLTKAFLNEEKRVVAVNCVAHIANSSKINKGRIADLKFPRAMLAAFQVIEYLKLFILKSPALNRINFVHPFSGIFSLIDKEVLLLSKGFNAKVSKPGFELLVRMRRHMFNQGVTHKVILNPEPICWVKVPESFKKLSRQRIKETRVAYQTFKLNKDLFFNAKYGAFGLINLPYLWLSLVIGPLFKLIFLILVVIACATQTVNNEWVFLLLITVYFFSVLMSLIAVLFQEKLYRLYSRKDLFRMFLICFTEPILYCPLTIYWSVAAMLSKK
ncbi:MAG: glycosyltransferase family 2 protein [Sphingobacteriaceae bacterium]